MGINYKHKYFTLLEDPRTVLDEFGRKVSVTGNSYMLLLFLCKEKNATVTDINDFIDREADISEENVRQYRYKIKLALGHDVISYNNHIYSIDGEVVQSKNIEQQQTIENKINSKTSLAEEKIIVKFKRNLFKIILIISAIIITGLGISLYIIVKQHKILAKPKDDMILIPAGQFIMGSTEAQAVAAFQTCQEQNQCTKQDYMDEYPQHSVYLPSFYIEKEEVSNADYQLFVKATNHSEPQYANNSNLNQHNQPVVGINWYDAEAYCQWIGERLATEAELEKAARGTDGRIYPWGNVWDGSKLNHGRGGDPGLDDSDGYMYSSPVGEQLGVSPYGVLNMAGNVWEWSQDTFELYAGNDLFSHSYYGQGLKVVKGGAYDTDPSTQRAAARYYYSPSDVDIDLGFRCVK